MIKNGPVITPFPKACLPAITRILIIEICKNNNIHIVGQDISVTELYNADEVFTTGNICELARVNEIDNRKIEDKGGVLMQLQSLFRKLTEEEGEKLPF
jgi:branched-chain amino acid aminotransferase